MSRTLSSLVCAAVLAVSCGANPNSPEVTFPVTLTLAPGQTRAAGDLSVTFIGVTQDSRCPAAALCITSGEAYVQVALSTADRQATQQLQVVDPNNRSIRHDGFSVAVETLAPYPITFNSIRAEDYRVTVRIGR